jgi:hypothetical protein
MNEPDTDTTDITAFEKEWGLVLRNSLLPSGEEMLAFYAGALPPAEATRISERIRNSPQALRDYAWMTEQTLDEVRTQLQPHPTLLQMAAALMAGVTEMVRRTATLMTLPPQSSAAYGGERFRGEDELPQQYYEIEGEPSGIVLIEQSRVGQRRYRVSGHLMFDDDNLTARGVFVLALNDEPKGEGDIQNVGTFDLGTQQPGTYRLELSVQSQVLDVIVVKEMRVGDPS